MGLIDDLSDPSSADAQQMDRRRFLTLIGSGALALTAVGTTLMTVRFFNPSVFYEEEKRFVIGRPSEIQQGTVLVIEKQKVFVVHSKEGLYALSAYCSHLGCIVRYDSGQSLFVCPCHGSNFTLKGNVLGGPAPMPLRWVKIYQERGVLVVDVAKTVPEQTFLKLM